MRESVLGKRIAKVLDTRRMTQTDLAKQVGVTEATITRYVHGSRFPSSKILTRIAATLNVSADYLIRLEGKKET